MARFVYYTSAHGASWGRLEGQAVQALTGVPWADHERLPGRVNDLSDLRLEAPAHPSKIVCVGRNYAAHARELNNDVPSEPLLFLKAPSALLRPEGTIRLPPQSELVHHEGELAVVMGKITKAVSPDEALEYVFGYTLMNDVTARDLQRRDVQFTRAKSFDTFAPLGPWLETDFEPLSQRLELRVNGALRQQGTLSQMIFPVAELIAYISTMMTLMPGDVISTGTPSGVGPLVDGDTVEVSLEGLGTLRNVVFGGQ